MADERLNMVTPVSVLGRMLNSRKRFHHVCVLGTSTTYHVDLAIVTENTPGCRLGGHSIQCDERKAEGCGLGFA